LFEECHKPPFPEAEDSTAEGTDQNIVVSIFGKRKHARVGKAILLRIGMKPTSVEPRQTSAIAANPNLAVGCSQDRPGDAERQTVRRSKHFYRLSLEPKESRPLRAGPHIAIVIKTQISNHQIGRH